jgi:hypothetical protein
MVEVLPVVAPGVETVTAVPAMVNVGVGACVTVTVFDPAAPV